MTVSRPSWQIDGCPAWCHGEHREGDHPDDRVHSSLGEAVPVIARRRERIDGEVTEHIEASYFDLGRSQRDGDAAV